MTLISSEISYPVGVRCLLPQEAQRRRRIEARLVDALTAGGYAEVILPIVDFVQPYHAVVADRALRHSYRFVDREGDLVAVRSDFTPMVARAVAPSLPISRLPLRLFYRGDVVRAERTRLGQTRECFQVGAELIGEGSIAEDVEVLRLAWELARANGEAPIITFTDASIAPSLVRLAVRTEQDEEALRTALLLQQRSAFAALRTRLEPQSAAVLDAMFAGELTAEDLLALEPLAASAQRLVLIGRIAQEQGIRLLLRLDDIEPGGGYYTGIRFRIFGPNGRSEIGSGGRYDTLYEEFGSPACAVGLTISVDALEEGR
jgi:ATP phosphoribosyltransferase regulatory subunit